MGNNICYIRIISTNAQQLVAVGELGVGVGGGGGGLWTQ